MAQEQPSQAPPREETVTRNSAEVSPIETGSPQENSSRNTTEIPPPLPARPVNAASQQRPLPQQLSQQPRTLYAAYPGPPQPYQYSQPVRVLPKMSQAYIATKLGLTVLSSVLAIILIALSSIFLSDQGAAEGLAYYAIPIAVAAIIWNTAELITYCVRVRKESAQRGIHPGAHVALHLLFWLACVFAALITVSVYIVVANALARCSGDSDDDDGYRVTYSYRSRYCDVYEPTDYYYWNYLPTIRALLAMFILAVINHFVLFVLACIDTHKRNLLKPAGVVLAPSQGQAVYYGAPPPQPGMPMPYYQYPVPQMAMAPPQQAFLGGGGGDAAVTGYPTPQSPEAKLAMPNQQSLYGFYAPAPMPAPMQAPAPSTAAPAAASPTPRQMEKAPAPAPAPAEATSSNNERAAPEQS